jgi:hypothetical protein
MATKRLPDAELRFYWDDRRGVKRWTIGFNTRDFRGFRRVEVTAPVDQDAMNRILDAVRVEMESWLF